MKSFSTILLLLFIKTSFAQEYFEIIPTQFDTFINRPSITWAAYFFDSVRFNNPKFSSLLVERMGKNEIEKACYLASGTKYANCIEYCTKEEIEAHLYPLCELPIYDSLGNIPVDFSNDTTPPSGIDSLSNNLLFTTQILYIENGVLKSYIPWVSPAFSMKTRSGFLIGLYGYFSTCINLNYDFNSEKNSKVIYIGRRNQRLIIDSINRSNMLKELYGKNLIWALWPNITNGNIGLYPANSNQRLLPEKIERYIVSSEPKCYDTYDNNGNIIPGATRCIAERLIPFYITEIEIIQDWYYDYTKNIVTCKIPEIFLYAGRDDDNVLCKPTAPVLKIVF